MKIRHNWKNRKYSKEEETFTEECNKCNVIKIQRYRPPYGVQYIDKESGELTELSPNCKEKETLQLNLKF